ncbi:hypothetical protein BDR04DRAFT_1146540 [Suillus decipiens]|nr:hypothetical protein BDR04DRAFT_1146540 [Suillus decipiens]
MRDKKLTSIKSTTQATCPYSSLPRPPPDTPFAGPMFFPQKILPDDDQMDTLPLVKDQTPHTATPSPIPTSPTLSTPSTPSPHSRNRQTHSPHQEDPPTQHKPHDDAMSPTT